MKLTLELIAQELEGRFPRFRIEGSETEGFFEKEFTGVGILDARVSPSSGRLYIIPPDDGVSGGEEACKADLSSRGAGRAVSGNGETSKTDSGNGEIYRAVANGGEMCKLVSEGGGAVCFFGESMPEINEFNLPFIRIVLKSADCDAESFQGLAYQVLEGISAVFDKYRDWQESLFKALQDSDLIKMVELSQPVFKRRLAVIDTNFEIMAEIDEQDGQNVKRQVPIPLEHINIIKDDPVFVEKQYQKSAYLLNSDRMFTPSLNYNIYFENDLFCSVVLSDPVDHTPFERCDYKRLEFLGSYVQLLFNSAARVELSGKTTGLTRLFENLIGGKKYAREELRDILQRNRWDFNETCFVCYLKLSDREHTVKTEQYYSKYISENFSGIYALRRTNHLILIVRKNNYASNDDFRRAFRDLLREGNFRLGFSNECRDVTLLPYFYRQAELALEYGCRADDTIWYHQFSDWVFDYLLEEACHEMPKELLCAKELRKLREYDETNNTSYYETLKVYLETSMNAVQSAKCLHIHHATMVYRLKRLKELIQIDFNNPDKRLYIHMSYRIMGDGIAGS